MKHHTPSTVVKPSVATVSAAFIGIDYHKRYSVYRKRHAGDIWRSAPL